jgi:hypothetical protein
MLRKERKTVGGADVSSTQVKEYRWSQRQRALRTTSVTAGYEVCSIPGRQYAGEWDATSVRKEEPQGASSRSRTNSASMVKKEKRDSTCFTNMPYVASEFGPLKEGIRRVDYVGRLARGLSTMLSLSGG